MRARDELSPDGRAWGGGLIAGFGFGWWVLMVVLKAQVPGFFDSPGLAGLPGVVAGFGFVLAGLACVVSIADLARGEWGRGVRGLVAGIVLLGVAWLVWLGTVPAGAGP